MKNKKIIMATFIGKTNTKNKNYFIDFLLKNSKIKTIFCNKLDFPKKIKFGEEWEIIYLNENKIKKWIYGNLIKKNDNNSNWFFVFNEWTRQILKINKINSIYKLYIKFKNINYETEKTILINIFLELLKRLGYSFEFKKCKECKKEVEIGFINLDEGGLLCFFCKTKEKITFHMPTLNKNINNNTLLNNIPISQQKEIILFLKNIISFINNRCGFYKKINFIF